MNAKLAATIICAWTLQGLPLLCGAGLVSHSCEPDCGCTHVHDGEPAGCGHEQDCPDDPCSGLSVGGERTVRSNESIFLIAPYFACVGVSAELAELVTHVAIPRKAQESPNLPFPPSDVPLLI